MGEQVEIEVPSGVKLNDRVFRTFDNELMTFAGNFYNEHHKKRISFAGYRNGAFRRNRMSVVLEDEEGNNRRGVTNFIVEMARKHELNQETVKKQIDRLGASEYL